MRKFTVLCATILALLLVATFSFSLASCSTDNSEEKSAANEIYMNQKGLWSNGVEFEILDHKTTSQLTGSYTTYTTQDKFLVIKLQVFNGSSNSFSAAATDVWLIYNSAKIYQVDIVDRQIDGFSDINQSPTTTKHYYLIFEVGKDVPVEELKLVIHNGDLIDSEGLVIKLKDSPKDCSVTLNYACERENDKYTFYSGTSISPSNFPIPEREGYNFLGWYFNADYSGNALSSYSLTEKQTLTLYAKWEKILHINYHYQYENKSESVLLEENSDYTLIVPSRLGYTFGGWFANSSYTGNAITILSNPQDDIDVFAKWTGNPVNIIFNGNGATSGAMENQAAVVGESKKLGENKYSKEGYIFLGWSLDSEDEIVYENQANFVIIPTDKEAIVLYATWMPRQDIPYTINHYLQNAYDNGYTLKHTSDENGVADSTISPAPKTYEGFTSPNAKTVTVAANGSLIIDYYYTRNSYTVSFVTNGGSSSIDTLTQKYETTFDLPTIERMGYTFGGWFIDPELVTPLNIFSVPSENISIYVWWQEENKPFEFTYSGINSIAIKSYVGESKEVCIPNYIGGVRVTEVSSYAFYNKNSIIKLIIPDTVVLIGANALEGMGALKDLTLPFVGASASETRGIAKVLGHVFGYQTSSSIGSKTSAGGATYQYFNSLPNLQSYYCNYKVPQTLKRVTITNQVEIPDNAFMNCDLLEEIILPQAITSIGKNAFYECQKISVLNIGNNVVSINDHAFYKCVNLSRLNSTIEGTFNLPANLTSIGSGAFLECSKIINVCCGDKLSQIGMTAFYGCSAISKFNSNVVGELIIPQSLIAIEERTFVGLCLITKVVVHDNVTSIGTSAFEGMSALNDLTLPFVGASATETKGSTKVLGHIFGYQDSSYESYKTSNGGATYQYFHSAPVGQSFHRSYKIPQSLRKVTITNQTEIPDNAFMNCDLLEEIILLQHITSIGKQAFYMCSGISEINIGNSLMSIGELAFAGCNNLKKIQIPISVTTINGYAFRNCDSLTIIYQGEDIPSTWDVKWNETNCTVVMGEGKK